MKQFHSIQRGKSLIAVLSAALAILLLAGSLGIVGEAYAKAPAAPGAAVVSDATEVAEGTQFTVTYQTGAQSAFSAVTKTYTADVSGCITLTGPDLKNVVTISGGYDCETVLGSDGRYYSFTGWHIAGQSRKMPNETVFQPGDVITPEVLTQYASGGKLTLNALWGKVYFIQNKYSNMQYEKVTRHYYNGGWKSINVIALNTNTSSGATGAYNVKDGVDNTGYNPSTPIATVDHLYRRMEIDKVDALDAYSTVAMLTGDLDYVKSRGTNFNYTTPTAAQLQSAPSGYVAIGTRETEWVDGGGYCYYNKQSRWFGEDGIALAVSFKSSQKAAAGTKYNFYYKLYDDEGQFRGSTRFDNVKLQSKVDNSGKSSFLGDTAGVILRMINGTPGDDDWTGFGTEHYLETTARLETPVRNPIGQVRACDAEWVALKGGSYDSLSHSWGDEESGNTQHYYYVGRNAKVTSVYGGTTDSNGKTEHTFPFTAVVTGGEITTLATTSVSGVSGSRAIGNRIVRVYGGSGHQPTINAIYAGGYGAPLTGDVDLLVRGCTNINHVRGGGKNYTSDVTGNINVRIENSTIQKDVFGGGLYGDCLDNGSGSKGKVTVSVVNSTVRETIYGSGQGSVNTLTFNTTTPQGLANKPTWWDTPETGFSSVNPSNGAIIQYVVHQLGRRSGVGNGPDSIIWMKVTQESYLSVAQVKSADITITNSTVGTVFGGGDLGHVVGNTNITITGSTVNSVYGGSNGTASLAGIEIFEPCDPALYQGPQPVHNESDNTYSWPNNYATNKETGAKYEYVSKGTYSWAPGSESSIDHDNKVVYSTEMANAGVVGGNTHITITGSSKITGAVYGGGNAGRVNGSTTVDIESGTVNSGASVYGGGKSASVASTKVNIKGGTFGDKNGNIYGGGDAGAVIEGAVINIEAGTFEGTRVYGGGKSASVASSNINITGGNFSSTTGLVYGGGQNGSVAGAVKITVKNLGKDNPFNYQIIGGGYSGTVGSVTINLENSTFLHNMYGGGDQSSATVLGDVTINATDITHGTPGDDNTNNHTLYGGGYQANVNGTITMNLNNGYFEWIHGGAKNGICKDVTINLRGGKAAKDPYDSTRSTTQPVIAWCLRGGGDSGQCEDVVINMWAGDVSRNTHTAGNDCTVASSTFNMYGGYTENIFGGGDHGNVKGNSQVNLYGGRVATIYGGGDRPTSRVGGSGVLVDDNHDDDPNTAGIQNTATLTVDGNIYGGSDQGIVMGKETTTAKLIANGSVFNYGTGPSVQFNGRGGTKVEIKSGTVKTTVFAGGNGTAYSDSQEPDGNSNFGSIRGTGEDGYSTQLLITGGTINASVYGGNNAAGQLAGDTLVKITGGTVTGNVYGGNLGGSGTYDQGGANIVGTATVQISGGTVSGEVYGGSDASGNIVEGTLVEITGGTVSNNVFGANRGDKNKNPAGAVIEGTATVRITGGSVGGDGKFVFGGNNALGTAGATSVEISGVDGTKLKSTSIYGGNNAGGTVTGQAALTIKNATVTWPFGGNFSGGTVGSTLVTLDNATSLGNVYGGNESEGTVTGQAQVVVTNNSTLTTGVYGGNYQGGTVGSTLVTFTDATCMATGDANGNVNGGIYGGNNNGGTITNNAEVTINSGRYLRVFGGNKAKGTIGGNTVINIYQGVSLSDDSPYVYGGNNAGGTISGGSVITYDAPESGYHLTGLFGGNYSNGTMNGKASITLVKGNVWHLLVGGNHKGGTVGGGVLISAPDNGKSKTIATPYGGNYEGGTINGNVEMLLEAGLYEYNVYGGNYQTGTINGNVTITVKANADIIREANENDAHVGLYGGNRNGGTITGMVTLNIEGSKDEIPYVFGGNNNGGTIGTKGDANTGVTINMTGGTVREDLYGGSNQSGTIEGSINVTIGGGEGAATVQKWVFGGGNYADVALAPNLTIRDNASITYACGGANAADVLGTNVVMTGGSVPTLFGGSNAGAGSVTGNTSVKISGGTITSVRGGGNHADTFGNTYVEFTGGTISSRINAAGNKSVVTGNSKVVVSGGQVANVYGGGDSGSDASAELHGDATIQIKEGANITQSVYGAGNQQWATSYGDTKIQISGGTIGGSVYGGGRMGPMVIDKEKNTDGGDTAITVTGGTIGGNIYGGGYSAQVPGNAVINCTDLELAGTIYGGGDSGALGGDVSITINSGSVGKHVFGGGAKAAVSGNVSITIQNGEFADNVYGGGEEGNVAGGVTMNISGGELNGKQNLDVYGGGKNGTVESTKVSITGITNISGSVFGGGEGFSATVFKGTDVYIDLPFSFEVKESIHYTDDIASSGQTDSELITHSDSESGSIAGSVYGGGNLGRVGDGVISAGGDKATIQTAAKSKVKMVHGYVGGSIFGGGRGIPSDGTQYNIRMGTVFGSTDVDILGGLVKGNVYGGGEQSRVYSTGKGKTAATVDIIETATNEAKTEFEKIAINGSVFGGGDRGEGNDANASVPTVYGDVYVNIKGHPDNQPSEIYFLTGGVYGDGNLCLVDGYRKITVQDFEPSTDRSMLKTFFSLQRADLAVLDNSAVVLLGATDLVEEGDNNLYSINRIDRLEMVNGSTVKLDQIVKYMGGLSSDVHHDVKYIHDGRNGFTDTYKNFTTCDGSCLNPLNDTQIQNYHDNKEPHTADTKNVLCVANGLYLEVINEKDEYGPVEGLFTLQLTYANPGEGGGFVYASIPESTGDFICETERWAFNVRTDVTASNYQSLLDANEVFIRVPGKGFRRPTEGYSAAETYYSREHTGTFMDIIDDVGGVISTNSEVDGYTYYYWYIGGPSVTFDVEVTGYIGAAQTSFRANTSLPQHVDPYSYVLYSVSANDALKAAISSGGDYQLVQTSSVTGQQIAVELRANGKSLGFLHYNASTNTWGIKQGDKLMTGYNGNAAAAVVEANRLIEMAVGSTNDQLTWVLYKSKDVTKTCSDLEVYLDIDLFEKGTSGTLEAVTSGTSALSYTTSLNIVRLTATQSAFAQNGGNYNGVANNETVHITGSSKFTVEWQTGYVPAANPKGNGLTMNWLLSTETYTYYMNTATGEYFTLNGLNTPVNTSDGLRINDLGSEYTAIANGYKRVSDNAVFSLQGSFVSNPIPAGTRITMVDMNGSTPAYYYYVCTDNEPYINLMNFKLMGTNTAISTLDASKQPAFIRAYDDQTMAMITERLVFVFDINTLAGNVFEGGLTLQHIYDGVDILDYAKADVVGNTTTNRRYFPKDVSYKFNPGSTGVNATTYEAKFEAAKYNDIGTAVLNVHVEEDENWINTLFRENGFAVKVTLWDASANKALAMPAGMYFEYRGQHYYPGPDSTYISVPVQDFGDHQITIHNPQFSLATAAGGSTANFKVEYFSAPDANYYNSFNTQVSEVDSYQIIGSPSYSLKVESGHDRQIYAAGEDVKVEYTTAKSSDAAAKAVAVTVLAKKDGVYTQLDWKALFADAQPKALDEGTGECLWKLADNAASGTYRLVFTYADHTEYVNLIVK